MNIVSVYQDKDTHDLIFLFDDGYKWFVTWIDADSPDTPEEEMEWDAGFTLEGCYTWESMKKEAMDMLKYAQVWEYIKERIPTFTVDRERSGEIYYEATLNFEQIKQLITVCP